MRCLSILFILILVYLVEAAIDDENNPNEIKNRDLSEAKEVGDDFDMDEVLIFGEESSYEEIKFMSFSKYIQFSEEETGSDDESDSHNSSKDALKRNKKIPPLKSSPSKIKVRKRRQASCPNTNQPTFNCNPTSKFRTIDGSCNNLKHPEWGMALGCQERFIPDNYDGKFDFRKSVKGGPLPEPRTISVNINTNESHVEKDRNHMSMFFGQACTHEIVLTASFTTVFGEILPCCQEEFDNDVRCANIFLPPDDPFYGQFNKTCMDFPRSVSCSSCDENGRKLLNLKTSFIDGSIVYGSLENVTVSLRANDGTGKLISQNTTVGELLPNSSDPQHDACSVPDQDRICFRAGDERVNQHIIITCLQTILMREHNRIATILKGLNPSWGEETLFQETRRILGALIQVVVFQEYLPVVLSKGHLIYYGLDVTDGFTTYNDKLNPNIWIEFSTAAFRVPHSSIDTVVSTKPRIVTEGKQWLRDLFSRPFGLRKEGFGPLIEDTTKTKAQKSDRFSVQDVNDFLYRFPTAPGGLDLSAIDIQRGRDNGIPTYVQMVKFCDNIKITSFLDLWLFRYISYSDSQLLKENYKSVEDVDLETALQMEIKYTDSVFGKISVCIVGFQFHHLKYGDRFYFQHRNQAGSFTQDQIKELRKASLAQIICKNVGGITALPKNAMLVESSKNKEVKCENVQEPNYTLWKVARA